MYRLYVLLALIWSTPICAQDIGLADSLLYVYESEKYADSVKLRLLDDLAFNSTEPRDIIKYAELLKSEATRRNNSDYTYRSLIHLGQAYRLKGEYEVSFEEFFKALNMAEQNDDHLEIGKTYCLIADTYSVIGDTKNATLHYQSCISRLQKSAHEEQLAAAMLNYGDNLLISGELDSALHYFEAAARIFDEVDYSIGQAYSIGNIGLVYARQGKYEEAENKLNEALHQLQKFGDKYGMAAYLIAMTDIYIDKNELWIALEYANQANKVALEGQFKEQIRDASLRLSQIYEKMNQSGRAFDFLKSYISYRDSMKNESVIYKMAEIRREYEIAQIQKNSRNVEKKSEAKETKVPNYYAMIIGINDYEFNDPELRDLEQPIADADLLYQTLLSQYQFEDDKSILITNPTRGDIINAFEALSVSLTEKDNLLIFYAGHGVWDEKLKIGYWLPADAASKSKVNWISNSTVRDYISGYPTKHTLLVSDACFSGSIFKTRQVNSSIDPYAFSKLYKLKSRKAMTSGTLNSVPDKSEFMKYLINKLKNNEETYMSARQLFYEIESSVLNNTDNVPQYGTIQNAGDEGGEFIFLRKH